MSEKSYTGGEIVVESLIKEGVDTVFGLPGVQNDWLYNALYDYREKIRVIHTRHEQGAGYMALGYNLASGKPGICNVVPGPGFLNSTAALATAWGLNAQVLWLVGQIPLSAQGKLKGALHEIPDQLAILRQLTKWADAAPTPAIARDLIHEAFRQMYTGRPRPVGVEVAMDVLMQKSSVDFSTYQSAVGSEAQDMEGDLGMAVEVILNAKNPLIFVGSGAMNASREVTELAHYLEAPVFSYRTGKGVVSARDELSFPLPAAYDFWLDADLAISIGSHMRMPLGKWGIDNALKLISINIDEDDHARFVKPTVSITSDAAYAIAQILNKLKEVGHPSTSRSKEWQSRREKWEKKVAYLEPQASWLSIIRESIPDEGIFVDELTQAGFASRILYEAYLPRTYLSTGFMGTLGWGFQTALGAKVAKPDVPVISVAGDGGFMFGVQELATAVQHKIGVILLLFNNNLYGNVRNMQEALYGNRIIATDLHNPDFVQLARLFGAHATRVHSLTDMRAAIQQAIGRELPTVIEIPVSKTLPSTNRFKNMKKIRNAL